jgi:hypothetical protein
MFKGLFRKHDNGENMSSEKCYEIPRTTEFNKKNHESEKISENILGQYKQKLKNATVF